MRSMTAFARAETKVGRGQMVVEIRSVNHRYLQPGFHLARECAGLEPLWREQLRKVCSRGKVDVTANFRRAAGEPTDGYLDQAQLRRLVSTCRRLFPHSDPAHVLNLPAVWSAASAPDTALAPAVQQAFDEALDAFIEQQESEGKRLAGVLREQLQEVEQQVVALKSKRPAIQQALRERWQARLKELQATVDAQRVEEEITVQVMRADVDEELARLDSHLEETQAALKADGAQGRKLDFLMQEFTREANTLASKAPDVETTNAALAIKVLVEQMREQIQNIE